MLIQLFYDQKRTFGIDMFEKNISCDLCGYFTYSEAIYYCYILISVLFSKFKESVLCYLWTYFIFKILNRSGNKIFSILM